MEGDDCCDKTDMEPDFLLKHIYVAHKKDILILVALI